MRRGPKPYEDLQLLRLRKRRRGCQGHRDGVASAVRSQPGNNDLQEALKKETKGLRIKQDEI